MGTRFFLIFGLIAGTTFIAASTLLGALFPNYDPVTQTISEIGEKGSPFETIFKIVNLFVAGCFLLFAFGVYRFSKRRRASLVPAALLGFFASMELGVFIFESPHPWHNVFGILSIAGFLAPLALAITWPSAPDLPALRPMSAIAGATLVVVIGLNLSPLVVPIPFANEHIGLVQRTLLVFHVWCAYLAFVLYQSESRIAPQAARPG
jgi:hypothetical membrane protein